MNPKAVDQALSRLNKAKDALFRLHDANRLEAFEAAWIDILIACSGIYSKLEQGSKGDNSSEPWFGAKKRIRRNDMLLRYLHQARNAEEHGIDHGVDTVQTLHAVHAKINGAWTHMLNARVSSADEEEISRLSNDAKISIMDANGNEVETKTVVTHTVKLLPIKDGRSGMIFQPPTSFEGIEIPNQSPIEIARIAIDYMEGLIAEARQFVRGA